MSKPLSHNIGYCSFPRLESENFVKQSCWYQLEDRIHMVSTLKSHGKPILRHFIKAYSQRLFFICDIWTCEPLVWHFVFCINKLVKNVHELWKKNWAHVLFLLGYNLTWILIYYVLTITYIWGIFLENVAML